MNIKEKIEKLLRLAGSKNENESKAALLKAKELMTEHKLSMADFEEVKSQEIVKIESDICFTSRTIWIADLAQIISDNYCCGCFYIRYDDQKKRHPTFKGYKDDVELCNSIFTYTHSCIEELWKQEAKRWDKETLEYYRIYLSDIKRSFIDGFLTGLKEAYEKQFEEKQQEWGLVLVTPKEVMDEIDKMKKVNLKRPKIYTTDSYSVGYKQGKDFNKRKKVYNTAIEEMER